MQLNDILADAQDQDRGREFEFADPVAGKPTGMKLRIAGPDSATQNRARLALSDKLVENSDDRGQVSAEMREKLRIENLAACVLGWEITEDNEPVPFTQANVVRLLTAATWVQAQVDHWATLRGGEDG